MRFNAFAFFGILWALVGVAASPLGDPAQPELEVIASFPEDNPFGQIVNGERNRINLLIENKSEQNVTLLQVGGNFDDVASGSLIKNVTALSYGLPLMEGTKIQLPYTFHSEFKPGDIKLHLWLTYIAGEDSTVYRAEAYDSIVTVVEPPTSIFDYQVITTYLITAAFLGGLGYFAWITFVGPTKKTRKPAAPKPTISAPVGKVTATGAGGYEEEWIPEHHLKGRKSKKGGVLSSGDELSGGETSGAELKKKKGKK